MKGLVIVLLLLAGASVLLRNSHEGEHLVRGAYIAERAYELSTGRSFGGPITVQVLRENRLSEALASALHRVSTALPNDDRHRKWQAALSTYAPGTWMALFLPQSRTCQVLVSADAFSRPATPLWLLDRRMGDPALARAYAVLHEVGHCVWYLRRAEESVADGRPAPGSPPGVTPAADIARMEAESYADVYAAMLLSAAQPAVADRLTRQVIAWRAGTRRAGAHDIHDTVPALQRWAQESVLRPAHETPGMIPYRAEAIARAAVLRVLRGAGYSEESALSILAGPAKGDN